MRAGGERRNDGDRGEEGDDDEVVEVFGDAGTRSNPVVRRNTGSGGEQDATTQDNCTASDDESRSHLVEAVERNPVRLVEGERGTKGKETIEEECKGWDACDDNMTEREIAPGKMLCVEVKASGECSPGTAGEEDLEQLDVDEPVACGAVSTSVSTDWSAVLQHLGNLHQQNVPATAEALDCSASAAQNRVAEVAGEGAAAETGSKQKGRKRAGNARLGIDSQPDLQHRVIEKSDFASMEILGQFNMGFIIARLGDDLYILDQHACDEKYRYETLQRSTNIGTQPLVVPQDMDLEAPDEMVVEQNLEIFRNSGFELQVDMSAPPCKRVKLVAVPLSKGTVFGATDVHEMLCLLRENPGVACRPSRVSAMFASRACRSAIMIGKSLTRSMMRQVVDHMGTMDQPWNCPHGRPTMRHLFDLKDKAPENDAGKYKGPQILK